MLHVVPCLPVFSSDVERAVCAPVLHYIRKITCDVSKIEDLTTTTTVLSVQHNSSSVAGHALPVIVSTS